MIYPKRYTLKSMQSETLHITFALFSIFHKVSSTRKPNLIHLISHEDSSVRDEK